jgi:hypothetical protein
LKEVKASRKRLLAAAATMKADQEAKSKSGGKKTKKVPVAFQRKIDELEVSPSCNAGVQLSCTEAELRGRAVLRGRAMPLHALNFAPAAAMDMIMLRMLNLWLHS